MTANLLARPSLIALLVFVTTSSAFAQTTAPAPAPAGKRIKMTLNDAWKFLPEDRQEGENPNHDDSDWQIVDVPHTWNAFDPFDDAPGYRRGQSWYRKRVAIDPQLKGKRLFLYFEGVHQKADVFINNRLVGQHRGGYTAFSFDVTKHFRTDPKEARDNLLAVRADSSWQDDIAPLDIGFAHYGGIYRDVWLIATDPVHFDMTNHASPGIFVDTPEVSAEKASVRVRGTVVNDTDKERTVAVRLALLDPAGKSVAEVKADMKLPASGKGEFEHKIELSTPHLWSPDMPTLYSLVSTIVDGDTPLDEIKTNVGFRWFKFDPNEGFSLNGKKLFLKGASRHQDYANLGSAVPNSIHRSDLQWLKDMGGNFIRLAHYPQDPEVLATADRIGLLVWEEIPIVSTISSSPEFLETSANMLREMIRQHYNHPSVILWGTQNETLLNWVRAKDRDPELPEHDRKLLVHLDGLARQEDPTRSTVIAMNIGDSYDKAGLAQIPHVAGWNLYTGWYSEGFENFGKFLDGQHKKYPERVLFVSEYGAGSDERLHSLKPHRFDHSVEWMNMYHESHLRQAASRPYLVGLAIWNQFDFSQPEAADSIVHMNQKGMMTFDRRPKDVYYLYQANWRDKPMIHIATREWLRRSGTKADAADGAGLQTVESPVRIYSNLEEVELFLDGKSLGKKKPDDVKAAEWQAPLHDGYNDLEARGQRDGKEIRDVVRVHFTYRAPKLADPSVPFKEIAVNASANVSYTDPQGLIWEADQEYKPGSWGFVGGIEHWKSIRGEVRAGVLGTLEDPLYQTPREGVEAYRFDVPDGDYELELRFAEFFPNTKPGERVFRVIQSGEVLIDKLDLMETYGPRRAVTKSFITRATDGQGLHIKFEPIAGKTTVSGVRLRKIK
jgi:beta-galactosidase